MRDCGVLLVRHASSAYGPSLYVDDYGECRLAGAGRPLFLDPERANALMTLWLENGIARAVAAARFGSDSVVSDNFY